MERVVQYWTSAATAEMGVYLEKVVVFGKVMLEALPEFEAMLSSDNTMFQNFIHKVSEVKFTSTRTKGTTREYAW